VASYALNIREHARKYGNKQLYFDLLRDAYHGGDDAESEREFLTLAEIEKGERTAAEPMAIDSATKTIMHRSRATSKTS